MNAYWAESIATGIFICLYLQLLVLGLFNLWNKPAKNKILGAFCCFLAMPFIYTLYWPTFNHSLFFNILLGGYKHLFLPALLFLYIRTICYETVTRKQLLLHLTLPTLVHLAYMVIKFGFRDFYTQCIGLLVAGVHVFIFISYVYYIVLGIPILRKLKSKLLKKGYIRYALFFWVLTVYELRLNTKTLSEVLLPESDYRASFDFLFQDFYQILAILITTGVLIFAILESPSLKSVILGDRIYNRYDTISDAESIRKFIHDHFETGKAFTHPDFKLKRLLKNHHIAEIQFKLFLRKEFGQSPLEFVNTFRINEFKAILLLEENRKYSLMGIAEKVGFSSKATFYRQFKQQEGITPKQYLDQMKTARG